LNYGATSNPSY